MNLFNVDPDFQGPAPDRALAFLLGFSLPLSIAMVNVAWVGLILLTFLGLALRREKLDFHRTPFDAAIVFFVSVWLISSLFGLNPGASLKAFSINCHFLVFYFLLFTRNSQYASRTLNGYLWGAGAAMGYGWFQYGLETIFWSGGPAGMVWEPP